MQLIPHRTMLPMSSEGIGESKQPTSLLKSLKCQKTDGQLSSPSHNTSLELSQPEYELPLKSSEEDEVFIKSQPLSDDESSNSEQRDQADTIATNWKAKKDKYRLSTRSVGNNSARIREKLVLDAGGNPPAKSSPLWCLTRNSSESIGNTPKKAKFGTSPEATRGELDIFGPRILQQGKRPKATYGRQAKKQGPRGGQSNSESSPESKFKKPPKGT